MKPTDDRPSTGDLLQAVARSLRRSSMSALAGHDVTPSQVRALRVILGADEAPRLSDVAARLRVAPRTATEVVDALEERALVHREPDPDDRRATRLQATAEGRHLGHLMAAARERAATDFLARLSEHDRTELHRILAALVEED